MEKDERYPREGFVVNKLEESLKLDGWNRLLKKEIEAVFQEEGDKAKYIANADRIFMKEGNIWIVEAKGETSSIGLDFRTGLGQLLQKISEMQKVRLKYALAFPDEKRFHNQAQMVPQRIRKVLNLYFIAVNRDGDCRFIKPEDDIA